MSDFKPVKVKDFYNNIHHQYYNPLSHKITCQAKKINETILKKLRDKVEGPILDVGCASQIPVANSFGCDISIEGLKMRKTLFSDNMVICADINALPFKAGSFSGFLAGLLFDHVEEPERAFSSLNWASKPGSILTVTVFDSSSLPGGKYADNKLRYMSITGEAFSVPSYSRTRDELINYAALSGWDYCSSFIHGTQSEYYRLLQINFQRFR